MAVKLKVWYPDEPDPLKAGLKQLDRYLDTLRLDSGTLIIFDRRPSAAPVADRTAITRVTSPAGRAITLMCA